MRGAMPPDPLSLVREYSNCTSLASYNVGSSDDCVYTFTSTNIVDFVHGRLSDASTVEGLEET